jgi:hypothetical protein
MKLYRVLLKYTAETGRFTHQYIRAQLVGRSFKFVVLNRLDHLFSKSLLLKQVYWLICTFIDLTLHYNMALPRPNGLAISGLIAFLLVVLLRVGARAQQMQLLQPQVITDLQRLPQAFVPAIVQDKVATRDGLCRYDGQRFKVFKPDPDEGPSLSFAGLNQLELDRHGRIWSVSERGGYRCLRPTNGNLHQSLPTGRLCPREFAA